MNSYHLTVKQHFGKVSEFLRNATKKMFETFLEQITSCYLSRV